MGTGTTGGSRRSSGLKDEKRQKLIEAAVAEFNEYGCDNASFNRIIECAGLSKGTVYYYFDNKDALLNMVFEEISSRLLAAVPDLPIPDSPKVFWDTLWAYRQNEFDFFAANPDLGEILIMPQKGQTFLDFSNLDPDGPMAYLMRRHIELIQHGQELGAIRNDITPTAALDIMRAIDEALCKRVFGNNMKAFITIPQQERQECLRKYNLTSQDMICRLLLPVKGLHEWLAQDYAGATVEEQ